MADSCQNLSLKQKRVNLKWRLGWFNSTRSSLFILKGTQWTYYAEIFSNSWYNTDRKNFIYYHCQSDWKWIPQSCLNCWKENLLRKRESIARTGDIIMIVPTIRKEYSGRVLWKSKGRIKNRGIIFNWLKGD